MNKILCLCDESLELADTYFHFHSELCEEQELLFNKYSMSTVHQSLGVNGQGRTVPFTPEL